MEGGRLSVHCIMLWMAVPSVSLLTFIFASSWSIGGRNVLTYNVQLQFSRQQRTPFCIIKR